MYAEHNESEDPNRDWEFSVEFHPEERSEYAFYIAVFAAQREVPLRTEEPQQEERKARGKAARPRKHVHKRVLQRACY